MQPGIYDNISNENYHGGPGISKSGLDLIHRSPLHYAAAKSAANDNTPTPAQAIGTAFHAMLLEPELFAQQYVVAPNRSDFPEAIEDREVLVAMVAELNAQRQAQYPDAVQDKDQLVAMVQALNASREAAHPDAIRDREVLVAMIAKLNETRLPKLSTGGTKAEQIARLVEATAGFDPENQLQAETLEQLKAADLKVLFEKMNQARDGLLSTSGGASDLAASLRANGCDVVLWSEILQDHLQKNTGPYIGSTNASTADLAAWLRAQGMQFQLWSEILDHHLQTTGVPFIGNTSGSRHDMAAWLSANGQPVLLWSDVVSSWTEANAHRTILSTEQWNQLTAMRDAVLEHPAARALLTAKTGVAERSVYWVDSATGELCRCRPDFWREDDIVVDVKTTDDASPDGFARSIVNWRYDVQDPFYRDGIKAATGRDLKAFVFLAVEKKAPYAVGVYVLDQESIDLGRAQYRADLDKYAECVMTEKWPGYGDKIQTINLPAWHANKNAHLLDAQ